SNTGQGFEILALNGSTSAACETARLTSWQFLGRCRSTPAEQLVVSTRIGGLQICEVVVLECPQGTFGTFCDQVCRCAGGRACDRVTGICPSGCESGYKGDTCSTECTLGTYGANCSVTCGLCFGGAHCDIISEYCTTFPCQSGWQGGRCDM
ncbi:CED1-like protein, partial [Mya arenaria]